MKTRALLSATAIAALAGFSASAAAKSDVTITRTTYGIPHVKARDFAGLGYGSAYAQAQDNVCTLADVYLSVSGERSKFLGSETPTLVGVWPAKNVESDLFYRTAIDTSSLEAGFKRLSPEYRSMIDGYVAGYNRYLAENGAKLPKGCSGQAWVRPITRETLLRWINGFALFSSSSGIAVQIANAAPPAAEGAALPAPATLAASDFPAGDFIVGSNGWAFGGEATSNGKGLVVANPHFPWTGAYRFYQIHHKIAGKFDVAGATILGQPYIGIGFNKDVAWTHTLDNAVHMTIAKLALDPTDPTYYLVDGKREAMDRREILIEDRDGAPVRRTVYSSRFGPIAALPGSPFAWTRDTAFAVSDANKGNIRGGDTYIGFGRAKTVDDLRTALVNHMGPGWVNTIAADRAGNAIFADITPAPGMSAEHFAGCGAMGPKLPGLYAPFYIVDGSRSACEWRKTPGTPAAGILPGAEMAVQLRRDYVQNANDSYRWTNPALAPDDRQPMLGVDMGLNNQPSMRTRSSIEEIQGVLKSGKFDIDLAAQTMLGNKVFAARFIQPAMAGLCKRPAAPAKACAALARWDGKVELESRSALLATVFWSQVEKRADIWKTPLDPLHVVDTPSGLLTEGAKGDALLADLTAAAAILEGFGLSLDAPLGEAQFSIHGKERIPVSGGNFGGILNAIAAVPVPDGANVIFGSSYIHSVTFDDNGPVAKTILTFSQSTDPASPHSTDQTRAFSKKQLIRYPFSDAEIAEDAIGAPLKLRQ